MTGSGKDNRNLVDSGGNQKLSHEDIAKMKEDGVSGQVRVIYLCVFFHKFRSMYLCHFFYSLWGNRCAGCYFFLITIQAAISI